MSLKYELILCVLITAPEGEEARDAVRPDHSDRGSYQAFSGLLKRVDNLLVRIPFIIVMIRWTGLAPWAFEFPFPGSLTSTFLNLTP